MKRKLESQLLFDKIPSSYILDSDDNPLEYNISSRTLEAVDSSDIEILPPGDIPEKRRKNVRRHFDTYSTFDWRNDRR